VTAPARSDAARGPEKTGSPQVGGAYSKYVLAVLVLVYILNFLDRQIITILAEDIKADLGISDAEIGFLYGTAFAVFYAIFGIPLGRLADVWNRRTLIALGLGFWSAMTAVSGLAHNFGQLAAARIGVGVGEASATPAAFSMLTDSFSPRVRATVLAIYSSGIYIGAGLGIFIGGQIVERWDAAFGGGGAPFGLVGWQAAYLAVGIPGLLVAIWVRTLREPRRGAADGVYTAEEPHPFREFARELRAVVPPFTLLHLWRVGAGSRRLWINLAWAVGIGICATGLVFWSGDLLQWAALGVGLYAAVSWMRALALRDPTAASLIFRTASLRWAALGFSFLSFAGYGIGGWTPVFFRRIHEVGGAEAGTVLGLTAAAAGLLGITLAGWIADRWRATSPVGRIDMGIIVSVVPIPLALWMLATPNTTLAYVINFPLSAFAAAWIGIGASTIQDLVLPRMRAIASAFYILLLTFIGLALGPYMIGKLSDGLGDLATAMRIALFANVLAAAFLLLLRRHLARDEATLLERAQAAGEQVAGDPQP
jgi:MFS family permease